MWLVIGRLLGGYANKNGRASVGNPFGIQFLLKGPAGGSQTETRRRSGPDQKPAFALQLGLELDGRAPGLFLQGQAGT